MKITRASYDAVNNRFVGSAIGSHGDRIQIDIVGPSAFLLNRVMRDRSKEIIVEADDDTFTLRSVQPEPSGSTGELEDGSGQTLAVVTPEGNLSRVLDIPGRKDHDDKPFRRHLQEVEPVAS